MAGAEDTVDAGWRKVATAGYALSAAGYAAEAVGSAAPWTRVAGAAGYALVAAGEATHRGWAVKVGRGALLAFACLVLLEGDYLAAAAAVGQFLMLAGRPLLAGALLVGYYAGRVQEHASKALDGGRLDSVMLCSHVLLGAAYARELGVALADPSKDAKDAKH